MTLEQFDFIKKYREDLGLNVGELIKGTKIPQNENGKIPWHNKLNHNVLNGDNGLCVFCGSTSNNLLVIDLDDEKLFEDFKDYNTFITKTGRKGYHLSFRTFDNPKSKSLTNDKGQHIDILGQGKIAVLPPTIHPDTKRPYEIISDVKIKQLTREEENGLYQKIQDLGFKAIDGLKPVTELHDPNFKQSEGTNRSETLLRVIDSWKIKNPEYDESDLFSLALNYNNKHLEPYSEDKIKALVKQGFEYGSKKIKERANQELIEEKKYDKDNFALVANLIQNENHFVTFRENKQIWYYENDEGIYKPLGDTIIAELCQRMIRNCKREVVKEVTDHIRRNKTMIDMIELLESRHINTQNGILDPNTFEIYPHSYKYLTTSKLPFAINPHARNLKLWNHILTIIDTKDINLIMELIWICISWNNPFKKMFVFKGESNTQKSTLADILVWIIGRDNVSREKPEAFLAKGSRFSTSKFIGKRINIASEIGNLTKEELENQKSLIGAELQNTERKNDNAEYHFDPTHFVFLYTTNKLGGIYSSINDNSVITRFQFLVFRNRIDDMIANGQWDNVFFTDEKDRQSAIETIVNIIINYKKAQTLNKIPKTKWSSIAATKEILKEQMPLEDKYFEDERIIRKEGSKLSLEQIKTDFVHYVGYEITSQKLGYILKNYGFKSRTSNGVVSYKGWGFNTANEQNKVTQYDK